MIREVRREEIPKCVELIRKSFQTVADDLGLTAQNAPRFTAFATTEERLFGIIEENAVLRKWYEKNGAIHIGTKKFDFFPFTCGYLKKSV